MSNDANLSAATGGSTKDETVKSVPAVGASTAASVKKDSTNELPMLDIGEAINFVSLIHEKGLENAQMPDVATQTGYKHPSSTPFYRRCVAARLFGMLAKSGPELTARARTYLKPDNENARVAALRDAIMGIQLYADEVNKLIGKRINNLYVANSFQKVLPLTDGCAAECAINFERSLKFAGFLATDGTVVIPGLETTTPAAPVKPTGEDDDKGGADGMQSHTLYLDKTKTKKFSVSAPLDLTPSEIKRIQKWLEVTLLVDWNEPDEGKQ
jgi:hypothetical protein